MHLLRSRSFAHRALGALTLGWLVLAGPAACGAGRGDASDAGRRDVSDVGSTAAEVSVDAPVGEGVPPEVAAVSAPARVPRFPTALPFEVARVSLAGEPPTSAEVAAFTGRMVGFFTTTDFFRFVRRLAHGLADDNPWGQPPYAFWWHDTLAVRQGDTVTFRHVGFADNMMADVAQVLSTLAAAFLTLSGPREQESLRPVVLGYIRGLSATMRGSIWAEEDPVVDTIMARGIFHRNHAWQLDGGRRAAVDYEPVRREVFERRHDTLQNAANPTWGDIYVRTKRSKDDFPWLFRVPVHLSRILWTTGDPQVREAALALWDQLQAFAADIVDHGYLIRAKGQGGAIFIPYMEGTEVVDDFASLVAFEALLPNAECNAKLGVALMATGDPAGNACGAGISTTYEEFAIQRFYGHTGMQWNFHLGALALALLYGADDAARGLLEGLGVRLDELMVRDDETAADPRYPGDLATLLVLAATYGLPLTPAEARLVMREYAAAADHYQPYERWDPWAESVLDGEYDPYPARESTPADGPARTHLAITGLANLFEYCASPVRSTTGAPFVDCDLLTSPAAWVAPGARGQKKTLPPSR